MSPNSLMGSVVVQGPALAVALANHFPRILITETHPKLTMSSLGIPLDPAATREHRVFSALSIVGFLHESSDDLIDAVVASYVAWAVYTEQPRWVNLLEELPDSDLIYPLGEQRSTYHFPRAIA